MLDYKNVIKETNAYNIVNLDISENRISHAYLFVSQDDNFLSSFIKKISIDLININETENIDKNILRINNNTFPDVKIYGQDKASQINVEVVSEILENAQVRPFEADKKVFVLLNVQNMNEASQNKILKLIEEPPKNTYFLMGASGVSRILQTILSRVKQIKLDEISNDKITNLLTEKGISLNNAQIFANCSNGNSTFAENLASNDGFIDFFDKVVSCFFDIKGSKDVLKYSSIFTAKTVDKNDFFDIAILISRDLSMILAGKSELVVCKNVLTKLKVISSSLNLSAVATLISTCLESKKDLIFNANQTAVIDNFLFKLAEVKVKCRRLLV
ncbi:MAG: hypothetical protein IJX17_08645 [Clostridia bacterium]|nr:hypothetical protein [Clostridia bacterium]